MTAIVSTRLLLFNKRRIDKWFLICALCAFALRTVSDSTAILSYVLLAFFALFGRAKAIQALTLSWFLTMLSPAIASDIAGLSIGRYLVIFAAASSVGLRSIYRSGLSVRKTTFFTIAYGLFLLAHSFAFSEVLDVSILKILAWTLVVVTLVSAWQAMKLEERLKLFDQLQKFLMVVVLISLPFLAIPSVGYLRNGEGFQGILNHPQAFGPTVALLGALIGGKILGEARPTLHDIVIFLVCVVLVVLSGARTAGLAMLFGLIGAVVLCPVIARVPRSKLIPGIRSRRLKITFAICMLLSFLSGPFLVEQINSFIFKRSDASSLLDAADASRGQLIQNMVANIQSRPLTGIGFGVASNPAEMEVERDAFFGLPLSAIVEKGVMPIAVLEELGVLGALVTFFWFSMVLRRGARAGVQKFAVITTLLLVNFGESMFFSVGGMGMLLLILLSGAITGESR